MKRFLSMMMVFALLLSMVVPASAAEVNPTVTLSADKETVAPGETVTLTLSIETEQTITNLMNWEYWIYFNADLLELTSTTVSDTAPCAEFGDPTNKYGNGWYVNVFAFDKVNSDPITLSSGTMATLTFTAKEGASGDAGFKLHDETGLVDYDTFVPEVETTLVNNAANVTVGTPTVAVTGITLDKTAVNLKIGGTETLNATVTPDGATDTVTWTSDNEAVATVADGVVTAVAAGNATITAQAGEHTATCAVTVVADEPEVTVNGYTFATSDDVTAENGGTAVVNVMVTGNGDETVTTYNAYDITLTFDSDKLEYVSYDGAVKTDNGSVAVDGNTIRIVGCGTDKEFATAIAALTFNTKAEGEAIVTVTKAQASDKNTAVDDNTPEATAKHAADDTAADATPETTVITVPYTVTKPDFVSGNDSILHGEDYTFSYTDTDNYTYTDLKVTVDGNDVTPTEADGVYTIENVTGAIVITATQTANSYDVTKPENVTGPDKATYGEDYEFTVTPSEDKEIESVTVTTEDGTVIETTINEDGEYVIDGEDISGPITITVTEKDKAATETTITFTGVEASEVEGGLTQTATIGQAFTFKLNKADGYAYTVIVGTTELTETDGQYTIPAELVVEGGVTVTITKVDTTKATVDVYEYISLDDKVMFLVTAKWGDKVLSYGEGNTMYWSSQYTVTGETEVGAYCWLVVSTDEMNTIEQVKAAAEAAIVEAAEGAAATAIGYDYDINETTKVDVNDAQLTYDMYNASYMEFTDKLPMLKFLEADMKLDMKLDVQDVAAIISFIVTNASN